MSTNKTIISMYQPECPNDHRFGTDCERYADCDDCMIWHECIKVKPLQDELTESCLHDHRWGKDCERHRECDDCQRWDECVKARKQYEKKYVLTI